MTRYARDTLRAKFFAADMGISGANFGVASTGSVVLVTNEGNGRMVTTLPRTHVVVMGVERLVPTFPISKPPQGAASRRGRPARDHLRDGHHRAAPVGEGDGPEELHVVIVDNGRSRMLGSKYEQVLSCIRCGACLDVCPVYRKIGGHAYDAVYTGPIGAVFSPLLDGLACHAELPFASSLCGACTEVCSAHPRWPSSSASCARTRSSRASWRRRGARASTPSRRSPRGRACGARSKPSRCRCCGS